MTNPIEAAGYIVHTDDAIYGIGTTEAEAIADAQRCVDHDTDAGELDITDATAALMAKVTKDGGTIAWGKIGDVACTVAEVAEEEAE